VELFDCERIRNEENTGRFFLFLAVGCGSKPETESPTIRDTIADTVTISRNDCDPDTPAINPEFTITDELTIDDIVSYYLPRVPNIDGPKINGFTNTLKFSVNSYGQVDSLIIITQSSGSSYYDNECIKALTRWRFIPSEQVSRTAEITFVYSLR